ncbi:uncharacterized protein LOC102809870 [Saccoglossus kowalevskii]|uniref:IgGFc-binding protein-like n=1 Tax=Saccoglossus kowalevskii TaxID=10224 RepID=A0ABM0M980_SACKO|nr:PREDICTED: IgGFc-binding protein-like [Saccoglossus kowalevskii]
MRVFVLGFITVSFHVCLVVSNTSWENVAHQRRIRQDNNSLTCHDAEGREGICRDNRVNGEGCFFKSRICQEYHRCNNHYRCFIPADPTKDEPCVTDGGICKAATDRCDGAYEDDLCDFPSKRKCCKPTCDLKCELIGGDCQPEGLACGGVINSTPGLCDGTGRVCCIDNKDDSACVNAGGECKDIVEVCSGWYDVGKCSGFYYRQCCRLPGDDTPCTNAGGVCRDSRTRPCHMGDYRPNLCSGPSYRQCCLKGCDTGSSGDSECREEGGCCRPLFCAGKEQSISATCPNDTIHPETSCVCCQAPTARPVVEQGDPIFNTLDKKEYRFDGECSYVLLRECSKPLEEPRFVVTSKHGVMENLKGNLITYVKGISIYLKNWPLSDLQIDLLEQRYVSINKNIPLNIREMVRWNDASIGVTIEQDGPNVKVDKEDEFTVWFNGNGRVNLEIVDSLSDRVCGLLGNGNGNPDDDFLKLTPDGLTLVDDVNEFGESWVVDGSCS